VEGEHLSRSYRFLALAACLLLVQTGLGQDVEPPNVLSFDFDPKAVDTLASSQDITFTARLTDDLSGVRSSELQFLSPSENQYIGGWINLISGSELDGIYEMTMTVPKYSERGTWKLSFLTIVDNVGNRKWLSKDDLVVLGFPTEFEVTSNEDIQPPNVLSFDFTPKAVDTSTSSQEITLTARFTDDRSGVRSSEVQFLSPSENQYVGGWINLISGSELDGIYEMTMAVPKYSERGTWKLSFLTIVDNVGNRKWLSKDNLVVLGFPIEFDVTSNEDIQPPNVLSFDFTPKAVDTSTSSQEIILTARLTDDLCGVRSSEVQFLSPSENQYVGGWINLISGSELDGIYEMTLIVPKYSERGTWRLSFLTIVDNVGNRKWLSYDDLVAVGFPTTFRNAHSGPFSISGMKFNDINNNGAKDAGESGLPGWRIELLFEGEVIDSVITGADGTYSFDHLEPKSYTMLEVQKAGWVQTYPPGGSYSVTLVDADSTGNDFGNHQIMKQDTKPPEIVTFDFDPKTVDTSTSSQEITATARLTDDLSGVDQGSVRFYSPSQSQSIGVWFSSYERTSGSDLDGVYLRKMTLPRYSEPGTWKLDYISIYDKVGNRKRLSQEDSLALGFPAEFEVASVGDSEPPEIVSLDFDPKAVDTSASSQEIRATVRLTDDLSGIDQGSTRFYSPSRSQSIGAWFSSYERISGTYLDGVYEHKMTLPRYSEPGTWNLDYISIYDKVGNRKRLSFEDAVSLGFPTEFEVASVGDFQPPSIITFDFDPKAVDTSTMSQEVTITAHLTDDLSGVDQGSVLFYSPSRSQSVGAWLSFNERTSGDEFDGIYRHKMTLPQYSEAGIWTLEYISIYDTVGNKKQLSYDEASALGFPISFQNGIDESPSPGRRIARWQRPLR